MKHNTWSGATQPFETHSDLTYLSDWPAESMFTNMINANTGFGSLWDKPPIWMGPGPPPPPPRDPMGGMSRGGRAPGSTDTVPAMLTPGEFVVNAGASQAFGSLLERINGYAPGGWVIPPGTGNNPPPPTAPSSTNPLDVFAPTKPPVETPPWSGIPKPPEMPPPPPPPGVPPMEGPPPVEGVPHLPEGVPGGVPVPPGPPGPPPGPPPPPGVPSEGTPVGAEVAPYEGYGEGFNVGGGIIGVLESLPGQAINAAISGAAGAASANPTAPGSGAAASAGAAAASAAISAAIQIGLDEANRAIEFGAQAAGIGVQGLMETFLPTGGSELANQNWVTRIMGGIVGAAPNIPNLAGGLAQDALGQAANLPGVGPATPEQVAAQGLDPNRTEHTGTGPPPGPSITNGIGNVENLIMRGNEQNLGQDIARYQPTPGAR